MAKMKQRLNGDGNESSSRKGAGKNAARVQIPAVDFEALNFEQRRAPYNSGSRFIKDKDLEQPGRQDSPGYENTPN